MLVTTRTAHPGRGCGGLHCFSELYGSQLSGSIPESIGNLSALESLTLFNNQLSGSIPESIGNLSLLQYLALSQNQLSGSIPKSIGNLTALWSGLYLDNNQLSGSIPESIGNLSLLGNLYLGNNQLSGSIPESIGNLSYYLHRLSLSDNQLSGSIPESIGSLPLLQDLDLSSNQLSGSIPESISDLSELEYLDLSNNQLSGSIPKSIGNLLDLEHLFLSNNQLSGSIPGSIGNLFPLESLNLSNNQLSGSIPGSIGDLPRLDILHLQNNPLGGPLPASLMNLTLIEFFFQETDLCIPQEEAFQTWLAAIETVVTNGRACLPPVAVDDEVTTREGTAVLVDVLANDSGSSLHITAVSTPANGTAAVESERIRYTPHAGFTGVDSFTYTIRDPGGETASATVTVTVHPEPANDTTAPECIMRAILPGPPTTLRVRVWDTGSGLASIEVLQDENATVTWPAFSAGTTDSLLVTAEKVEEAQRSSVVLRVTDVAGHSTTCDPVVATVSGDVPYAFTLEQNYPNPFNPSTQIRFGLPESGHVQLAVYDAMGRRVATLVDGSTEAGSYEAVWDGRSDSGAQVAGGLYFYTIEAGAFRMTRSMVLLK